MAAPFSPSFFMNVEGISARANKSFAHWRNKAQISDTPMFKGVGVNVVERMLCMTSVSQRAFLMSTVKMSLISGSSTIRQLSLNAENI